MQGVEALRRAELSSKETYQLAKKRFQNLPQVGSLGSLRTLEPRGKDR